MNGKPDVLIPVDLHRVKIPTLAENFSFDVGYGNRVVIYVVQETSTDGSMLAAIVTEDGARINIAIDP